MKVVIIAEKIHIKLVVLCKCLNIFSAMLLPSYTARITKESILLLRKSKAQHVHLYFIFSVRPF